MKIDIGIKNEKINEYILVFNILSRNKSYSRYAREHHMGKYTLVAKNTQGHAVSNCDLIVRKKQFPPVFWKRLYNYETSSGSRIVAEIEVGGWPVPEVSW